MKLLERLIKEEDGQSLIEYSLILAVIALAIITLGGDIKNAITTIWTNISNALSDAAASE